MMVIGYVQGLDLMCSMVAGHHELGVELIRFWIRYMDLFPVVLLNQIILCLVGYIQKMVIKGLGRSMFNAGKRQFFNI